MALTEKQIQKRLEKCWDCNYSRHTSEAEWHGNPEENIWLCDIPSIRKSVRLTLDLDTKYICIEEREIKKYSNIISKCQYGEWKIIQKYWH